MTSFEYTPVTSEELLNKGWRADGSRENSSPSDRMGQWRRLGSYWVMCAGCWAGADLPIRGVARRINRRYQRLNLSPKLGVNSAAWMPPSKRTVVHRLVYEDLDRDRPHRGKARHERADTLNPEGSKQDPLAIKSLP
jgi:hypothetical protein